MNEILKLFLVLDFEYWGLRSVSLVRGAPWHDVNLKQFQSLK